MFSVLGSLLSFEIRCQIPEKDNCGRIQNVFFYVLFHQTGVNSPLQSKQTKNENTPAECCVRVSSNRIQMTLGQEEIGGGGGGMK